MGKEKKEVEDKKEDEPKKGKIHGDPTAEVEW